MPVIQTFDIIKSGRWVSMQNYADVMKTIANKELSFAIFWAVVLCIVVIFIWVICCLHWHQTKKKYLSKHKSEKLLKVHRQSFFALLVLSVICVLLGMWVYLDAAGTVTDINKDIEEETYITYSGEYYINVH